MRLSADIKWIGYSSPATMRNHLIRFTCSEASNLKRISEIEIPSSKVELRVQCGKVAKRSSFVFLKHSRNKSRIIGECSTNRLIDLINDFDFLEKQMNKSGLDFALSDPKVFDCPELFANLKKRNSRKTGVIEETMGTLGFVAGSIAFVFAGTTNILSFLAVMAGLIFLLGSITLSSRNREKYVLIQQE
jgi:hypothetical protein